MRNWTLLALAAVMLTVAAPAPPVLDLPVDGVIVELFDGPEEPWLPGHRGIDIAAQVGQEVTFEGWVVDRSVMTIAHPGGLRSSMEPVVATIEVGDHVRRGQVVGYVDEAPLHCHVRQCVHWGVRDGNDYVNPLDVLAGFGPVRLVPVEP